MLVHLLEKNAHKATGGATWAIQEGVSMTDKQKQSIREMRQTGFTYRTIAETIGIPFNTVKSFCRRDNVTVITLLGNNNINVCKYCGKPLKQQSGKKRKSYCNDKCRSDWWNQHRRWFGYKKTYRSTCHHCGAEFKSYGNKHQKFCGRDCYARSRYGDGLP